MKNLNGVQHAGPKRHWRRRPCKPEASPASLKDLKVPVLHEARR